VFDPERWAGTDPIGKGGKDFAIRRTFPFGGRGRPAGVSGAGFAMMMDKADAACLATIVFAQRVVVGYQFLRFPLAPEAGGFSCSVFSILRCGGRKYGIAIARGHRWRKGLVSSHLDLSN